MGDLLDPGDLGHIRSGAVTISSTSYRPATNPSQLLRNLGQIMSKASKVDDPYAASFLMLTGTSYLQAFSDGNKRMGRLLCNVPLLRASLPPLPFAGIEKMPYILGHIEFYETGSTGLLEDAVSQSYGTTAQSYLDAVVTQCVPSGLELRERERIAATMKQVFLTGIPVVQFNDLVETQFVHLPADQKDAW